MTPTMIQVRQAAIRNKIPPERDKFRVGFVAGCAWMKLMMLRNLKAKKKTTEWRRIKFSDDYSLTRMEQVIYDRLCSCGSISHDEISDFTGSFGISGSSRVHISNIRKKTGATIISVRGFGYSLNKP